jgi:hypothetical protein
MTVLSKMQTIFSSLKAVESEAKNSPKTEAPRGGFELPSPRDT